MESMRSVLNLEKLKNCIFATVIKCQTTLDIDTLLKITDEGVIVHNYENGNIPVVVHDYLETTPKTYSIKKKKSKRVEKYKAVKKAELEEEDPQVQEEKIRQVDNEIEDLKQENKMDIPLKETMSNISSVISEIEKSRSPIKFLNSLREIRAKLLGKLDVSAYTTMIKDHNNKLEKIWNTKGYDKKKINQYISITLSALDKRLIYYEQYYMTELVPDDIHRLVLCTELNMVYPKRYVPFSYDDIYSRAYNYTIVIEPVKNVLKRILGNKYGFPNIVYKVNARSNTDDPFSFYILKKIESGKRYWDMESRLYEVSSVISEKLREYCINLFRKMYFDMFNTHKYIEGYSKKTPLAGSDCEQLLLNIITLSKKKTFCNIVRDIVMEHSTIKPTQLDIFNFSSDDKVVKQNFLNDDDSKKDMTEIIKRVFDEISETEIEEILSKDE
jgi:hypothetical protein